VKNFYIVFLKRNTQAILKNFRKKISKNQFC